MSSGEVFRYKQQPFYQMQAKLLQDIIKNSQTDSDPKMSRQELQAYQRKLNDRLITLESKNLEDPYLESLYSTAGNFNEQWNVLSKAVEGNLFSEGDIISLSSRDWDDNYLSREDVRVELIESSLPDGFQDLPFIRDDNLTGARRERRDGSNSHEVYAPQYTIEEILPYQQFIANKLGNQDGKITKQELSTSLEQDFLSPLSRDLWSIDPLRTIIKTPVSTRWHDIEAKKEALRWDAADSLDTLFNISNKESLSSEWLKSIDDEEHKIISDADYYINPDTQAKHIINHWKLSTRAFFNLEAQKGNINLNILNHFLLHRKGTSNPGEKTQLDQQVLDLAARLDIKRTSERVDVLHRDVDVPDNLHLKDIDFSTRVMAASQLLALFKNRTDLLEKILKNGNGETFNFLLANWDIENSYTTRRRGSSVSGDEDNDIAGFYTPEKGRLFDVVLSNNALHRTLTLLHEMIHALDHVGNTDGSFDGYLPDMTQQQKNTITQEKERLKNLKSLNSSSYDTRFNYALKNEREFIAETAEFFVGDPHLLYASAPQLYDIYKDYFRIDPRMYPANQDNQKNNGATS